MWKVNPEGNASNELGDSLHCWHTFEVVLHVGDTRRVVGKFTDSNTAKRFLAKYARTLNGLETLAEDLTKPTLKALADLKKGEET